MTYRLPFINRSVELQVLKKNKMYKDSPLAFNVILNGTKGFSIFGLTLQEAIHLHKKLTKELMNYDRIRSTKREKT